MNQLCYRRGLCTSTWKIFKFNQDIAQSDKVTKIGTHLAPTIKVAFVNELAIIFNKLGINTNDVLEQNGISYHLVSLL